MKPQSYLIDTNILIGLEDDHTVEDEYASFQKLCSKHKVDVFLHEASLTDLARDKDPKRRRVTVSKSAKYQTIANQRGLSIATLSSKFGSLNKPNDVVDATLLHALNSGITDFLVTQDKGLHQRAADHSTMLARRVLFVADAVELLTQTYEPAAVPVRHVEEVSAHQINTDDEFFNSLRADYEGFDRWWSKKCVRQRRQCWIVHDDNLLAGLVVRKDETVFDETGSPRGPKTLKICTFKVRPSMRGTKLGELLLKKILWFAHLNLYQVVYLTTFDRQSNLIELLEYFGFRTTGKNDGGELILTRVFQSEYEERESASDKFRFARANYPSFSTGSDVRWFGIPIQETYHDTLFPDLWNPRQFDLFKGASKAESPNRAGNTIRKVYLCRAASNLGSPGSVLLFYKSMSKELPSQAVTALGVLEDVSLARSTNDLMKLAGGRSVYSEEQLVAWGASQENPVKVINFLLMAYINPAISYQELRELEAIKGYPQSIFEVRGDAITRAIARSSVRARECSG